MRASKTQIFVFLCFIFSNVYYEYLNIRFIESFDRDTNMVSLLCGTSVSVQELNDLDALTNTSVPEVIKRF